MTILIIFFTISIILELIGLKMLEKLSIYSFFSSIYNAPILVIHSVLIHYWINKELTKKDVLIIRILCYVISSIIWYLLIIKK
jgi:hypothetical protein